MQDEDKLYLLFRELQRAKDRELITQEAMEQVMAPISVMNEKLQDEYAQELYSVLRTSADEEEVLVRAKLCQQLVMEGNVLEQSVKPKQASARRGNVLSETQEEVSQPKEENGVYLTSFFLPVRQEELLYHELAAENGGPFGYVDNPYPCGIFSAKELEQIDFARVTVFYGGNGSGKSTLLNLIANHLKLNRVAPYNSGEMFDKYRDACSFRLGFDEEGFEMRIPSGSRIITSDDVFDYMLTMRTRNDEISEDKKEARDLYTRFNDGKTKGVQFKSMDDYDELRLQVLARSKSCSRRKFIRKTAGEEVKLNSNGETALQYFKTKVKSKTLYCLDEPENSLSPTLQLELVKLLEKRAYEEECQLIIATHSPFLLAMRGAKIYDLDAQPAMVRNWWELENTRTYFHFFEKHRALFE